jgi:hypothetical protein
MKQKEDLLFFYAIDKDKSGAARHIFWVHGRDKRAYLKFGDIACHWLHFLGQTIIDTQYFLASHFLEVKRRKKLFGCSKLG